MNKILWTPYSSVNTTQNETRKSINVTSAEDTNIENMNKEEGTAAKSKEKEYSKLNKLATTTTAKKKKKGNKRKNEKIRNVEQEQGVKERDGYMKH